MPLMTRTEAVSLLNWLDEWAAPPVRNTELKKRVYDLKGVFVRKLAYADGDELVKAADAEVRGWWNHTHDVPETSARVWPLVRNMARETILRYFPNLQTAAVS